MYGDEDRLRLSVELAEAFAAAPWRFDALAEAGAARLNGWPRWMEALVLHVTAVHRLPPVAYAPFSRVGPTVAELEATIDRFLGALPAPDSPSQAGRTIPPEAVAVWTPPLRHGWPVARIDSPATLADVLELDHGQLAWLADPRGLERRVPDERLRNYRYRVVLRPGGLPRILEIPKARLKEVQRWILREVLDHVPVHPAAHGFSAGRSVRTHAAAHVGQPVVIGLDLRHFFTSVSAARVRGIFRTIGYAPEIARLLTGLSTNVVPLSVWGSLGPPADPSLVGPRFWLGRMLATPHLPQGAPTSPALANLACFRLDRRLAGLAAAFGLTYTRYADDLAFSGRLSPRSTPRLVDAAAEIIRAEGFAHHPGKTRAMGAGTRQSLCGVVVNVRPNVPRREYDRLKAELHRLEIAPPTPAAGFDAVVEQAALRAQLRGRISWVASLNPDRGARLLERFDRIRWDGP